MAADDARTGGRGRSRLRVALLVGGFALAGSAATLALARGGSIGAAGAVAAATAAGLALLVERVLHRLSAELDTLRGAFGALAEGDTSRRLEPRHFRQLAELAELHDAIALAVGGAAQRVVEVTQRLRQLPERLSGALADVQHGAESQEASVEETASLLANINTSIRGINDEVESLAHSNEQTAASILQMTKAIERMQQTGGALQESVESSTASVHEMGASVRQVADSAETVQAVAEETAAAAVEMDRSIQEVGEHTRGASELTEQVSQSAVEGARSVGETIEGIAEIRDLTREAKSALEGLAQRISEIGQIATVIDGISEETNLLSLNAAIIAAQAGEHGAAFAVVADQVKTLARRTTESTSRIEGLIGTVQRESENAVRAMDTGIAAVEQGVTRSRGAGEALERIRHSARDASQRVSEIARATEAQGRNSTHVADAARRTSEQVQQISGAIAAQTRAADQILKNVDSALDLCRLMSRATDEQSDSSRYIRSNVEAVTDMIRSIQRNTRTHEKASEQVAQTFAELLDNARKGRAQIPEVLASVTELKEYAEAVGAEVARFEHAARPDGS